jgi:hypothetical protein
VTYKGLSWALNLKVTFNTYEIIFFSVLNVENKIHYVHRFEQQCRVADLPPVSNPLLKTRGISVMNILLVCVFCLRKSENYSKNLYS